MVRSYFILKYSELMKLITKLLFGKLGNKFGRLIWEYPALHFGLVHLTQLCLSNFAVLSIAVYLWVIIVERESG